MNICSADGFDTLLQYNTIATRKLEEYIHKVDLLYYVVHQV